MAGSEIPKKQLFESILADDLAQLTALLAQGGDANAVHRCESSLFEKMGLGHCTDAFAPLLVVAAGLGHADMVAALLDHGAEVGKRAHYWSYVVVSANEQTKFPAGNALEAATRKKHRDVIEVLKAHGAAD
jgi:hypothetical protein